jgi:hypothetical protein
MSEITKYEAYKKKLQGVCDENNLVFRFEKNKYPITLTIRPIDGIGGQMSIPGLEEIREISPDASITFQMADGAIKYKMSKEFAIGDALFSKIKNLYKNMHDCWVQHFFRNVIERELISPEIMPQIDEDDADDTDALPDGAEPLEEFEDELGIDVDEEIKEARSIVRMENKASTALLQRRMNVSEERAIEIMEMLEMMGVVGPHNEDGTREVLPYDEPEDDNSDEDGADNE